jgi:hypothetical protein
MVERLAHNHVSTYVGSPQPPPAAATDPDDLALLLAVGAWRQERGCMAARLLRTTLVSPPEVIGLAMRSGGMPSPLTNQTGLP